MNVTKDLVKTLVAAFGLAAFVGMTHGMSAQHAPVLPVLSKMGFAVAAVLVFGRLQTALPQGPSPADRFQRAIVCGMGWYLFMVIPFDVALPGPVAIIWVAVSAGFGWFMAVKTGIRDGAINEPAPPGQVYLLAGLAVFGIALSLIPMMFDTRSILFITIIFAQVATPAGKNLIDWQWQEWLQAAVFVGAILTGFLAR